MITKFFWPIDEIQEGISDSDQSGPESNGNEEVLYIPQNSRTGASSSDEV